MVFLDSLPKAPAAAARARRVLDRLDGRVDQVSLDNARLLVSELIANVLEHVPGSTRIGLRVALAGGVLRVEVHDSGLGFRPSPRGPGAPEGSGWGLHFVSLLADRWASESNDGHCVWFEIRSRAAVA